MHRSHGRNTWHRFSVNVEGLARVTRETGRWVATVPQNGTMGSETYFAESAESADRGELCADRGELCADRGELLYALHSHGAARDDAGMLLIAYSVECVDCCEIAHTLFDHDIDVHTADEESYKCDDGALRCLECALRYAWPEDFDREARNVVTWAGIGHPAAALDEVMARLAE